jgi:hypothetical protein
MTNLRTILFTAIVLLLFILLIVSTHTSIEPFAAKKCSNIPFKKIIKDSKSPAEYEEWKKNEWDKMTSHKKDSDIEQWDKMPCADQNQWYKFLVDRKKKREAIDNNV